MPSPAQLEQFFQHISLPPNLPPAAKAAFAALLQEKVIPAKTNLITPGKIANVFYFILQGATRFYSIKEGEDVSDYFFFENALAGDYASFYTNQPSLFYLETLEKSTVLVLPKKALLELYHQHPSTQYFGRMLAQGAFLAVEERLRLLHHQSLEGHLEWLLEKFPMLFQRVPQYHIASYLGVRPESLSRIKRTLLHKKKQS